MNVRLFVGSLIVALAFVPASAMAQKKVPNPKPVTHAEPATEADPIGAIKHEDKTIIPPEQLAAPAAPAAPAQATDTVSANSSGGHLFGLHASVGLPHPINFGVNYVLPNRMFSAEISTGSFALANSGVDVTIQNAEVGLRYHPFAGSFFVGALFGSQNVKGKKTESITDTGSGITYSVNAEVEVKSSYATPHLGWMWGSDDGGFFTSFELGFQSPSGVKTTFSTDAPSQVQNEQEYLDLKKDVEDGGDKLGNTGLPHVALIKIGWLF